jgi:beta-xylosidase
MVELSRAAPLRHLMKPTRLSILFAAFAALAALLMTGSAAAWARGANTRGARAQPAAERPILNAYLFAYFKGNGEDGLHLAYSWDGLNWTPLNDGNTLLRPVIGKDRLMRDPHITRGPDGLYHLVWTSSWTQAVIGYANSPDLIHWSEQRAITPMTHEPEARNVWAPELFYDTDAKQYLLFWATTIPGRFPQTDGTGDKEYNHRIYVTTTKDFQAFTPTRLFYDQGFNVIDATIIRDGKRYVMFLKDETRRPVAKKNIRHATSRAAAGPYGPASAPITGAYWAEGPSAIRVGKRWIVYFDKYTLKRYGAVASTDLKRWEDISEQVTFPAGARHGTVISVSAETLAKLRALKETR